MRFLIVSLSLLLFSLTADSQSADALVKEGVALHDKGLYDEAIKKYDAAIAIDKDHYLAYYEKSYSLMMAKKYEDCIGLSKYILTTFKDGPENKSVYINYGTCYDYLGKPKESLEIYDEGIKKYPDVGLLYFNKAVTLYGTQNIPAAIETIKLSIRKSPYHASSHHFMSVAVGNSNKVYSLLASLTFLAIDQESERAKYHLSNAETVIGSNVKKTGEKSTTITLVMPDEKNKNAEDQFRMVEMAMSLSSALNSDDKYKNETRVERMERNLEMVFSQLKGNIKDGKGFGWSYYATFFADLYSKKYQNIFSHMIYSSANDAANEKWLEDNKDKVTEFKEWFKSYNWNNKG
ncbi:MAG TPA: tetratricopeptide repeat protein [Chitinophagaceae bacterium]